MSTEKENLSEGDVLKGVDDAAARIRARRAVRSGGAQEEKVETKFSEPPAEVAAASSGSGEEKKKEAEQEEFAEVHLRVATKEEMEEELKTARKEKRIIDALDEEIRKIWAELREQAGTGKITTTEYHVKSRVLEWPYQSIDIETAKERINLAFMEKDGINKSETRRLLNILEIPEDEIDKIIASERKEDSAEEKKEGVSPMEEKFSELEQRFTQREKNKDALLEKAEEFKIAVIRYKNIQNIFNTDIDPAVHNGEKNHLISLFKNADIALKNKSLSDFNYFLDQIEFKINEILRKIEEERQAKEAEKEITREAEKLPEKERQGFLRKLANTGWFLKEQKAKAMKCVLKETAEQFLITTKEGRDAYRFRKRQKSDSEDFSNRIRNLKTQRNEILKELKEDGKTEKEINDRLKGMNAEIDEILKREIDAERNEGYREKEKAAKEKEAGKIYRFLNAYSKKVYEKEEKLASKKRKQAKMGKLQKASGMGQLFGNLARTGRIFYDFGRSLNPLKSITAASLFLGRFSEAAKEARLMNTEVISRTRIGGEDAIKNKDTFGQPIDEEYLRAYEEALMIQEEAKKAGKMDETGNLKLSEEMYENAYKKFVNFDVLKRVGAYDEIVEGFTEDTQIEFETETDSTRKVNLQARIQFLKTIESSEITDKTQLDMLLSKAFLDNVITEKEKALLSQAFESYKYCVNTRSFSQRAAVWSIKKQSLWLNAKIVDVELDEKLTAEQKKLKQDFYFQMFESYLKDVDRMVSQTGMVDLLSYTARLTEKTAKAVSVAMIVDTVWKLWEGGLDIFSGEKRIFAPSAPSVQEEAPVKVPEKQENSPAPERKGREKEEEETGFVDSVKEFFSGTGIRKKEQLRTPSEIVPEETPAPKTPKEGLEEMDQFLDKQEKELKEMDEFLKQQEENLSKEEERGSFKIPLIQTEEAFADYKSRFEQLNKETKKEVIEILKKLPRPEKERIWNKGFEGAKGQDGLLNYALDRKARNNFDSYYNFVLREAKIGNSAAKEVVNMFNIQKNEDTALNILKGKNTFHGKTGSEGLNEYMSDYIKRVEAQKVQPAPPPPVAETPPPVGEEESVEKTAEQQKKELEQRKRELREPPQRKAEKSAPMPPPASEQKRAEKLIPRPRIRPEILPSEKRSAIIEKGGSLWNAVKAMNLKDETFQKAWADAKIYIDGKETDLKAHEVGLTDPKTKVFYNEKTNTIHIIPPEGGEVGDNADLNERFQKKGVETPDWLKKELDMETEQERAPDLLEEPSEEKPEIPETEEFKEPKEEEVPKSEESSNKVEELSEKTGLKKEDINSIAENLKIEPEKLEQSFLEIVKSDREIFESSKGVWNTERLEFFHNHSEIQLRAAQEIFKNTAVVNGILNTDFTPQDFYSRFLGHKIQIFDDSEHERVIIKTPEHEFYIYKNKAEIDQRIFKSLFTSDKYISVEINPKEISAEYLDDIFKRITEKSKRETALFGFIEEKLKIGRDPEGKIVGEEDNKTFDWLYKTFNTADLKTVLDENWPKKFRGAIPVFKSKEEKSAETLREFFIEFLKKNKNIALEDGDYEKPCGEVLAKNVEKLTTKE